VTLGVSTSSRLLRAAACASVLVSCPSCRKDDTQVPGETPLLATTPGVSPSAATLAASGASPTVTVPPVEVPLTQFSKDEPPAVRDPAPSDGCSIDAVGDQKDQAVSQAKRTGEVRLIGWAADQATKTVPPVAIIELAGPSHWFAPAVRATPRPDVAAALGVPSFGRSGWDLLADFSAVPAGVYDVRIRQVSAAGMPLVCDAKRRIEVK
jgi:hypothetical protein